MASNQGWLDTLAEIHPPPSFDAKDWIEPADRLILVGAMDTNDNKESTG